MKECSYFTEEKCDFNEDTCWYRHNLQERDKIVSKEFECRFCGKIIKTKPDFMKHSNKVED